MFSRRSDWSRKHHGSRRTRVVAKRSAPPRSLLMTRARRSRVATMHACGRRTECSSSGDQVEGGSVRPLRSQDRNPDRPRPPPRPWSAWRSSLIHRVSSGASSGCACPDRIGACCPLNGCLTPRRPRCLEPIEQPAPSRFLNTADALGWSVGCYQSWLPISSPRSSAWTSPRFLPGVSSIWPSAAPVPLPGHHRDHRAPR